MPDKLTNWYPSNVKPVRIGVYRTTSDIFIGPEYYSFWDGHRFNGNWDTVERAFNRRDYGDGSSVANWRGLARKPR